MTNRRDGQLEMIKDLMMRLELSANQIASAAGLQPSTLYRFLDEDSDTELRAHSERKIRAAFALPQLSQPGFSEPEAVPIESAPTLPDPETLAAKSLGLFRIQSRSMEAADIVPGDVIAVALNQEPKPHDIVCAQVFDTVTGEAETLFRWFEPPFLVAGSPAAHLRKPLLIDDNTVIVKGPAVELYRQRQF
ncbi:MAG: hypothetical protein AAGA39_03155 [Pseudomonadota bacterium]